ncbi:hypothetical protein [Neptunomonas phycophila]|uniref:hypothetical protein n=1 Tax=Neptunomonas phycophila TaxID=1572645 RepID=UPI003514A53E
MLLAIRSGLTVSRQIAEAIQRSHSAICMNLAQIERLRLIEKSGRKALEAGSGKTTAMYRLTDEGKKVLSMIDKL